MPAIQTLPLHAPGPIVASLDIGTCKVTCLVATLESGHPRVLGLSRRRLDGMKGGAVADRAALSSCLCAAMGEAEDEAGETAEDIYVSFSGGGARAHLEEGVVDTPSGYVGEEAMARVFESVERLQSVVLRRTSGHALLHTVLVSYALDGGHGVRDPRGLFAERLTVLVNIITVERTAWNNLKLALAPFSDRNLHLLASPWASAMASLDEDEKVLGAAVVDLGAERTTFAYMEAGRLLHLAALPLGGAHVTRDIARGLGTGIESAERAKTLRGHASARAAEAHERLDILPLGAESGASLRQIPRRFLLAIIQARLEETFALLRKEMENNPITRVPGLPVVLVGGGARLPGIVPLAERLLDCRVRLAQPLALPGLPDSAKGPETASAVGALLWALEQGASVPAPRAARTSGRAFLDPLRSLRRLCRSLGVEF